MDGSLAAIEDGVDASVAGRGDVKVSSSLLLEPAIRVITESNADEVLVANIVYICGARLYGGDDTPWNKRTLKVVDYSDNIGRLCRYRGWEQVSSLGSGVSIVYLGATNSTHAKSLMDGVPDHVWHAWSAGPYDCVWIMYCGDAGDAAKVVSHMETMKDASWAAVWPASIVSQHVAVVGVIPGRRGVSRIQATASRAHYRVSNANAGHLAALWDIPAPVVRMRRVEKRVVASVATKAKRKNVYTLTSIVGMSKASADTRSRHVATRGREYHSTFNYIARAASVAGRPIGDVLLERLYYDDARHPPDDDLVTRYVDVPHIDDEYYEKVVVTAVRTEIGYTLIANRLPTRHIDIATLATLMKSTRETASDVFVESVYGLLDRYKYVADYAVTLPISLMASLASKYGNMCELFAHPGREYAPRWWSLFDRDAEFGSKGVVPLGALGDAVGDSTIVVATPPNNDRIVDDIINTCKQLDRHYLVAFKGIYGGQAAPKTTLSMSAGKYTLAYGDSSDDALTIVTSIDASVVATLPRHFALVGDYILNGDYVVAGASHSHDELMNALAIAYNEHSHGDVVADQGELEAWLVKESAQERESQLLRDYEGGLSHYDRLYLYIRLIRQRARSSAKTREAWHMMMEYLPAASPGEYVVMYPFFVTYIARLNYDEFRGLVYKLV